MFAMLPAHVCRDLIKFEVWARTGNFDAAITVTAGIAKFPMHRFTAASKAVLVTHQTLYPLTNSGIAT
ncbi:hypothetical protein A0H81_06428 [Grifola frondosa]|uniref:Uncharacterized protein n=1 Tax=Grifola frondosa TaxID=5627 RepID=A0A1C7MA70_GRIFR|nr:hypothetical protein A0H81_06428 [Grifola frondosa]